MHHEIEWGIPVVIYLYFGGLSAGLFVFSAFASYLRDKRLEHMAQISGLIAPIPLYIGLFMLMIDLGRPLHFWRLFVTIEWTSPMSIGSWLIMIFSLVATGYAILWLPKKYSSIRMGKRTFTLPEKREPLRSVLGAIGFPLGLSVGIYTGVLLGAVPARPFWNTPMVAMLFLISALSTAAAALLFISSWKAKKESKEVFHAERKLLYSADVMLILFEIMLIIPYILHNSLSTASQAESVALIMGGPFSDLFWYGFIFIGLLIPLILEAVDLIPEIARRQKPTHMRALGYLSSAMVLFGGFLLRYIFVYAGQSSGFGG